MDKDEGTFHSMLMNLLKRHSKKLRQFNQMESVKILQDQSNKENEIKRSNLFSEANAYYKQSRKEKEFWKKVKKYQSYKRRIRKELAGRIFNRVCVERFVYSFKREIISKSKIMMTTSIVIYFNTLSTILPACTLHQLKLQRHNTCQEVIGNCLARALDISDIGLAPQIFENSCLNDNVAWSCINDILLIVSNIEEEISKEEIALDKKRFGQTSEDILYDKNSIEQLKTQIRLDHIHQVFENNKELGICCRLKIIVTQGQIISTAEVMKNICLSIETVYENIRQAKNNGKHIPLSKPCLTERIFFLLLGKPDEQKFSKASLSNVLKSFNDSSDSSKILGLFSLGKECSYAEFSNYLNTLSISSLIEILTYLENKIFEIRLNHTINVLIGIDLMVVKDIVNIFSKFINVTIVLETNSLMKYPVHFLKILDTTKNASVPLEFMATYEMREILKSQRKFELKCAADPLSKSLYYYNIIHSYKYMKTYYSSKRLKLLKHDFYRFNVSFFPKLYKTLTKMKQIFRTHQKKMRASNKLYQNQIAMVLEDSLVKYQPSECNTVKLEIQKLHEKNKQALIKDLNGLFEGEVNILASNVQKHAHSSRLMSAISPELKATKKLWKQVKNLQNKLNQLSKQNS